MTPRSSLCVYTLVCQNRAWIKSVAICCEPKWDRQKLLQLFMHVAIQLPAKYCTWAPCKFCYLLMTRAALISPKWWEKFQHCIVEKDPFLNTRYSFFLKNLLQCHLAVFCGFFKNVLSWVALELFSNFLEGFLNTAQFLQKMKYFVQF